MRDSLLKLLPRFHTSIRVGNGSDWFWSRPVRVLFLGRMALAATAHDMTTPSRAIS
jgi:hypothetical protein